MCGPRRLGGGKPGGVPRRGGDRGEYPRGPGPTPGRKGLRRPAELCEGLRIEDRDPGGLPPVLAPSLRMLRGFGGRLRKRGSMVSF